MKTILKLLVYEFDDSSMSNRRYNNADYFFALIYLLISMFNAYHCAYDIRLFDENGAIEMESISTILIIVLNFVILIRMYIKLQIQYIEEGKHAEVDLKKDERYDKIIIESLELRLSQIKYVWLICLVVAVFICFFGNVVVRAVSAIAVICALLTFFNDIVDIAVNKYSAQLKPAVTRYIR